jgi:hypothetical protein
MELNSQFQLKTIYDIFKDVFTKKSGGTLHTDFNFEKVMNPFMMARLLRMSDKYVVYANVINRYSQIWSKEEVYLWLYKNLPKLRSAPYNDYLKKAKKEEEKKKATEIDEDGYQMI